ncbi:MAG TPA: HAD family hydrolase [Bacillota bacterium]
MSQNYQLAVADLDGTLVSYNSNVVSKSVSEAVRRLRQNGVEFTIATGRSWAQAKPVVAQLGITAPVIVQTGALVIDPLTEQPIYRKPLRREIELKLRQMAPFPGIDQFCLATNGVYYAARITTKGGDWLFNFGEKCRLVQQWLHRPEEMIKHLFIGAETDLKQLGLKISQKIVPTPNLILWPPDQNSDDWFLEVFDPLTSKGQALQWLAGYLDVEMKAVIAFGDSVNDLDMLQLAGTGVAIAGAVPEVLASASVVIPAPEVDGIGEFLNRLAAAQIPLAEAIGSDDGVA